MIVNRDIKFDVISISKDNNLFKKNNNQVTFDFLKVEIGISKFL